MIINFELYIVSSLIFILTPGIDTVFVLTRSFSEGQKNGLYSSLGISIGVLFHTLFAALGLAILIKESPFLYSVIKYSGAIYLLYVGISSLLTNKNDLVDLDNKKTYSAFKSFYTAVVTNILNPKVALFFISFFPQFVKTSQTFEFSSFFKLGAVYAVMCFIWLSLVAIISSKVLSLLNSNSRAQRWIQKLSASSMVGLGLKMGLGS